MPQRRKFLVQLPNNPVVAPVGMVCEMRHYAGAFESLSDAFKGLIGVQATQFGKTVALGFVLQQVASEYFDQIWFCDKRRKRQKHKPAFRPVAAPVTPAGLARL